LTRRHGDTREKVRGRVGAWALGRKSCYRCVGVSGKCSANVIALVRRSLSEGGRSIESDESDEAISGLPKAANAGSRRGAEAARKKNKEA